MDETAALHLTPVGWHVLAYEADEPCDWVDHSRSPAPPPLSLPTAEHACVPSRPVTPYRVSPVGVVSAGPSRGLALLRRA